MKPKTSPTSRLPAGRPKGAKGKATLLKEAIEQGFEDALKKDFTKIMEAVVSRAIKGDMRAAKMILDRAIPIRKAVDISAAAQKGFGITINVSGLEAPKIEALPVIEGEVLEHGS